jgi:ADP-ribosylglycohydrolase
MVGGGPFNLEPGEWTDDTSLALCLALSLIEKKGFDAKDQLGRYLKWYQEGYLSVNGDCFDIGNTTLDALLRFEETGEPYCGSDDEFSAGNGSIMRLAPVPIFYHEQPQEAMDYAGLSSRTTHQNPLTIDACKYMAGIIVGALTGSSKEEILSARYSPVPEYWIKNPLTPEIDTVASGSFKELEPPIIRGRGFVAKSLEAALWAFYNSDNFKDGCLKAVNLGEDADTTGAIYGQIAGAYYGESKIPEKWKNKLVKYDLISEIADKLIKSI